METLDFLEEITLLPVSQRMLLAEKIIGSVRKEEQKISMQRAAELAYDDYKNDKELTAFTRLDGENFYWEKYPCLR
jgi:hypothetical protein